MVWHKIVGFVQMAYGDLPQTMENNTYSRATTPEQMVTAAVVESINKYYEEWTLQDSYCTFKKDITAKNVYMTGYERVMLINKKKNIEVLFRARSRNGYSFATCEVQGIVITPQQRDFIIHAWHNKHKVIQRAINVAHAAKQDMERNERAWDLAERLLNMKRNEHGALVPVVEVTKLPDHKKVRAAPRSIK